MIKVTEGWGSGGVGCPDPLSRRGPTPSRSWASREAACALAAVVTHAVLCRGGPGEPGRRVVALTEPFVCSPKSAFRAGTVLGVIPPLCSVRMLEVFSERIPSFPVRGKSLESCLPSSVQCLPVVSLASGQLYPVAAHVCCAWVLGRLDSFGVLGPRAVGFSTL